MDPDLKEQEVSSATAPVLEEEFRGRPGLRDLLDPAGLLGFLGQRESLAMAELQASTGFRDLLAKAGLAGAPGGRERRALRITPRSVWG